MGTKKSGADAGEELKDFIKWLKSVPRENLDGLIADAFWKGQLKETEIHRFFLLSTRGVDMRGINSCEKERP
jgi:hypothetical protein